MHGSILINLINSWLWIVEAPTIGKLWYLSFPHLRRSAKPEEEMSLGGECPEIFVSSSTIDAEEKRCEVQ